MRLKVVPGASRDQVVGAHGDRLRVKVTAPPEGGKANDAVRALLARRLGLAVRDVSIVQGATSARKTLLVRGIDVGGATRALASTSP